MLLQLYPNICPVRLTIEQNTCKILLYCKKIVIFMPIEETGSGIQLVYDYAKHVLIYKND